MSYTEWKDKVSGFKKVDVRGVAGNFFQGLKKQVASLPVGQGMEYGHRILQFGNCAITFVSGI